MASPSDDLSFYKLVIQCVARSEVKLNKTVEQLDRLDKLVSKLVAKRQKGDDQRSLKYLREVITEQNDRLREQKRYIKELEKQLKL